MEFGERFLDQVTPEQVWVSTPGKQRYRAAVRHLVGRKEVVDNNEDWRSTFEKAENVKPIFTVLDEV